MKPIPPFAQDTISKAMNLIIAYHEQHENDNNFIDASFLSFYNVCAKGSELPLIEHLCSRGYITYTDEGNHGRKRIVLLPAGYTYIEDRTEKDAHRKEELLWRYFNAALSVVAIIVSIIALFRS